MTLETKWWSLLSRSTYLRGILFRSTRDQKRVKNSETLSLDDVGVINSRSHGYLAVFSGDTGEIKNEVREQTNKMVTEWRQENKAQIVPGVIFIDEVHMLDLECFSFLNRMIESDLAPILVCRGSFFHFMPIHFASIRVMATNKGKVNIRGTTLKSPHGIPIDLLDRCLIIRTQKYADNEIKEILTIRANDENVEVEDDAFENMFKESFLRYAIQLISVASVVRQRWKGEKVSPAELKKSFGSFIEVKRCKAQLKINKGDFINIE